MIIIPRKLPLHVVKQRTQHGKVVFYFRIGQGKRTRLPDIGAKDFKAAYRACLSGNPIPAKGTEDARSIAWLLAKYKESPEWKLIAPATRRSRDYAYKGVLDKSAEVPYRSITKRAVENGMEDRMHIPATANSFLKAMISLFKWAVKKEYIDVNPTTGVDRLTYKTDGFPVWTLEDVHKFCEVWPIGTKQRLAFELALHTGLRRSDLCRIGIQHLKGDTLTVRTHKTAAVITVTLTQRVLDIIRDTPTGDLTFLVSELKRPFVVDGFGNWFAAAARKAGIDKNSHGLRKLSATLAAEGGATGFELMGQYGWSNMKQTEPYTRGADRVKLGKSNSKIVAEQIEHIINPHPTTGEGSKLEDADKTAS
ncbi:tyrosine-type recombinase/integrase [Rhizobium sp. PL01]|uniref:tyrosine-type recombinase/integrase n=1 Tax=Rhizobium sp. PL01 TaxID=3085631 RepID=UPI002980BACB|nr:tyrosine-type recombinase/integrase [Rhizobium sp. PL01]MDW5314537.1 tyrosine-type recombinase/integrase [Rhizobium sp. PL01]